MRDYLKFYIGGSWVDPTTDRQIEIINPATEAVAGHISLGENADVHAAVLAARAAFPAFAATSKEDRLSLLHSIALRYEERKADVAAAISEEMGAPNWLAIEAQAALGSGHLAVAIATLENYSFEEPSGTTLVVKEPIGVCAFITPWNWPINQIACKVLPALAVGCTMILKPSEIAPFSAQIWTEILHEAGVPPGVFNLVHGVGSEVGAALARHPNVDMVSFTGSTPAGVAVAREAADTVKRVHQELGGKSPNIVLPDANVEEAVAQGIKAAMLNTGQSCNAPTRLLVPANRSTEAIEVARGAAEQMTVGPPEMNATMGPVISKRHWEKIQNLIQTGIDEGATLVTGGLGLPDGLQTGYYVRPTVFSEVTPQMTIAREEIFGPVVSIMSYNDEEEAVAIANDTAYGLAAYVQSGNLEHARSFMRRIRAGQVFLNYADLDLAAPFGGYKQSGNGREWGKWAFDEFVEIKAVMGYSMRAFTPHELVSV